MKLEQAKGIMQALVHVLYQSKTSAEEFDFVTDFMYDENAAFQVFWTFSQAIHDHGSRPPSCA